MNPSTSGQTIAAAPPPAPAEAAAQAPTAAQAPAAYEACDQCGAPVEASQRYCVVCGTRRKHAYDPAARFLSGATSRARAAAVPVRGSGPRRRRSFGLATAAVLAAIPLAVAVGVLVGHSGDSADQRLLAALRAQKPTVVNVGEANGTAADASGATPVSTSVATKLSSDFSLTRGYAVQLQTLAAGASQSTVTGAERAARAKGATAVGLISQSDFKVTPSPPAGDYVIYSGQYKSKAAADAALAKLGHKFPGAKVIAVKSSSSPGSSATAGAGKVLASSSYGSAHQVTGFKPTASQLAAGGQIASKESKQTNSGYVNGQNSLPDVVSVP